MGTLIRADGAPAHALKLSADKAAIIGIKRRIGAGCGLDNTFGLLGSLTNDGRSFGEVVELLNSRGVQLGLGFRGADALIGALDPVVIDPDKPDQDDDQRRKGELNGREGRQTQLHDSPASQSARSRVRRLTKPGNSRPAANFHLGISAQAPRKSPALAFFISVDEQVFVAPTL